VLISSAFAQSAAPTGDAGWTGLLPIVLMFVLLYFLMIRPQMKKAKEHKTMLEGLQKGDEVVAMGILGRISKISDNFLSLDIAPNVTIQVQKQSVSQLLPSCRKVCSVRGDCQVSRRDHASDGDVRGVTHHVVLDQAIE